MQNDTDTRYFYADGENAIGPFSLAKLQQMVTGGIIESEAYVTSEGSDNWKPLSELIAIDSSTGDLSGGTEAAQPPPLNSEVGNGSEPHPGFWGMITRWPQALILAIAFLIFDWLVPIGNLDAAPLEWGLYALAAVLQLGLSMLACVLLKALGDARERSPVNGAMGFGVALLRVVLMLAALFHIVATASYGHRAVADHGRATKFAEHASKEFRQSIQTDTAQPTIGSDALVIEQIIRIRTQAFYGREQPQLNANSPMMMQAYQYQGEATGNTLEDKIRLLKEIDLSTIRTPTTVELLVNLIDYYQFLEDEYSMADERFYYNLDPYSVLGELQSTSERVNAAADIIAEVENRIARFFAFSSWPVMERYTLTGEMPSESEIAGLERGLSQSTEEQIEELVARYDAMYGPGIAYRGPKWWGDITGFFTLNDEEYEQRERFNEIRAELLGEYDN